MNKQKIMHINSVNYGSTGNIMINISKKVTSIGYESIIAIPRSRMNSNLELNDISLIEIGSIIERNLHLKLAYLTGMNGCYSKFGTKQFLDEVSRINPDIIHIHNLHNCYINLEMLFNFIKRNNISVVWTLHDCWAFTGQCPHYTIAGCDKWKRGCYDCPQYTQYPASRLDRTQEMYALKKTWFTGVENLTIVTPSFWLKSQVEQSFLSKYPVRVINNGIDLSLFQPTESNFRQEYGLIDKKILLGVANPWSKKKGLDIFKELSKLLDPNYKIVLIGLSQEQINTIPENILGLPKTNNPSELAKIYTTADFFINPSLEETMGLVTVEALACGTPVIVSNSTAVPEVINEQCGEIVYGKEAKDYYNTIVNTDKMYSVYDCRRQAKKFDMNIKYEEYIMLYDDVNN